MSALRNAFGQEWVQGLIAVLLAGLLVWFAGPYVAFADYKPFESVTGRLVGLLVIVVLWALIVQIRLLRTAQRGQALASAVSAQPDVARVQPDGPGSGSSSSADAAVLRERFQTAVAALRRSKRGGSLYDLPWYMIIGPPGSGKTTALQNAGLDFPLEKEFGRDPLKGVGGTRNCDWWITEQAILLDTAGRYTTQDSNEIADRAGWREFLGQLKRYRRRRPINGVLVAISVADLLHSSEPQREQHATAIRRRLDELRVELGIGIPVYLLLTKADLIAGFNEYFDDLNQAGRAQVWGVTFPLPAAQSGQALATLPSEYDLLVGRLQERVIARLGEERDTSRRAMLQAFPAQVAGMKPILVQFLGNVLRGATQSDGIWIRGCYFTSGTQEGTPIDRMLASMARALGLGLGARPAAGRAGKGKSFFLEGLLRDVIFQEAGLAGVNRRLELQRAALRVATYASIVAITVLGVLAMSWSYRTNRTYLAEVDQLAGRALVGVDVRSVDAAGVEAALPRLDGLRLVAEAAARYRKDGAPWSMRWGLFQGADLGAAADDAYRRELNASLAPWVGAQFEARLRQLATAPDALYEYLKAYLMLGNPQRLDAAQLKAIGKVESRRRTDGDAATADRVTDHFEQWLAEPTRMQPVALDDSLVEQARVALRQASLPLLMYSRLRLAYATETTGQVQLDRELSVGTNTLFTRRSGRPMGEPLSALYTKEAFESFTKTGRLQLMKQFLDDAWVLGDQAPNLSDSPRLAADVLTLYEQDYIRAWDELIGDLAVRPVRSLDEAKMTLALLASPSSPLKAFLSLVAKHTNLAAGPTSPGAASAAGAAGMAPLADAATRLASASSQLERILGSGAAAGGSKPGAQITAHFEPLHRLILGPPGGAPIDRTLADLAQLQQQISTAAAGAAGAGAVAQVMQQLKLVAGQLPGPVAAVVADVGATSGSLAMGEARTELGNRYQSQVVAECRELIGNRYPFNPASALEVTVADFARVFGPGGTYDVFFQSQLAPLVDTSRSAWRWKEETKSIAALPLKPFQDAERIRQAFFRPGSPNPELQVALTPEYLDAEVNRFTLTVDGQVLEYSHGPQRPVAVSWPSATPSGAIVAFEDKGGARPNRAYGGTWSLFRLFDSANVRRESDTRFVLGLSAGGREARVVLTAGSIRNPFAQPAMLRFRCGG